MTLFAQIFLASMLIAIDSIGVYVLINHK